MKESKITNFTKRRKAIFILVCISLIASTDCFSQLNEKNKKEYRSKTQVVFGYSKEYIELYLGITFVKVISSACTTSADTTYYIKFQLFAPTSESKNDICLNEASTINFLSKNGKQVDIRLTGVIVTAEKTKQMGDPRDPVTNYDNNMTFILKVTKEKLIEIGSEPFYNLILPYYNVSSNVENKATFKPTLFIRRSFIQTNIKYILNI